METFVHQQWKLFILAYTRVVQIRFFFRPLGSQYGSM